MHLLEGLRSSSLTPVCKVSSRNTKNNVTRRVHEGCISRAGWIPRLDERFVDYPEPTGPSGGARRTGSIGGSGEYAVGIHDCL